MSRAMRAPPKTAHVESVHYTHRYLWIAAQTLYALRSVHQEAGYWCSLASSLFIYLAFEGFLNDLGERIAPKEWAGEKKFFSREPYRGTLGKFRFLAEKVGYRVDLTQRPHSTLRTLDQQRNKLVHPRTERRSGNLTLHGPNRVVRLPPDLHRYGAPAFVERAFKDVGRTAEVLVERGRASFPEEMHDYLGGAMVGTTGHHSTWVPYMDQHVKLE